MVAYVMVAFRLRVRHSLESCKSLRAFQNLLCAFVSRQDAASLKLMSVRDALIVGFRLVVSEMRTPFENQKIEGTSVTKI